MNIEELNEFQKQCVINHRNEEKDRDRNNDYRMYFIVNKDVNFGNDKNGAGKLSGQVGHAVEIYMENIANLYKDSVDTELVDNLNDYFKQRKKIVLKAPQKFLEELEKENYISVRDLGLTRLEPNTLTVVNIGIYTPETLPKRFKRLRLY